MRGVLISGATGFIGTALVERFKGAGWGVRTLSRGALPESAFEGIQTVIHLAGEPIAAKRWTHSQKNRILESREAGTRNLVTTLNRLRNYGPFHLISASGVDYYGDRGEETLEEHSAPGQGFLPEVCLKWEAEARAFEGPSAQLRIGMVLGRGGALSKMLTPFSLGLGGPIGSGEQWLSWIHLKDVVRAFLLCAEKGLHGPINAVSPGPVRNREFARALGKALNRPAILKAPGLALKLALGEMSELLLASHRAIPSRLQAEGFRFEHPDIESALGEILR